MDGPLLFVERGEAEKGFATYFDANIRPSLETMEAQRLAALAEIRRRTPIAVVIAALSFAIGIVVMWYAFSETPIVHSLHHSDPIGTRISVFFFIISIVMMAWRVQPALKFKAGEKAELLPKIAGFFGPFTYRPFESIDGASPSLIAVPYGNRGATGSDELRGTYKGLEVSMSQLSVTSKGNRSYVLTFAGDLVTVAYPKSFSGVTLILSASRPAYRTQPDVTASLKEVELESPDFMRRFKVLSTDQVEARVLLPPDVMQSLIDLSDLHGGKWLQCGFAQGMLSIAIETGSQLFPTTGIKSSVYNEEDIHLFLTRQCAIFHVIDMLLD